MEKRKNAIVDIIYIAILQGTNLLIPILITPYLINVLGASNYGIFSFSLALIQYYILFVDFGFNLSSTNRISVVRNDQNEIDTIFWSTLTLKVLFTIICWSINFLILSIFTQLEVYKKSINLMFLMVIGNAFFPIWLFQGLEKIKTLTIINAISKLFVFPVMFFWVKTKSDFLLAVKIQSYIYLYSSLLSFLLIYRYKLITFKIIIPKLKSLKTEFFESVPIFLSNLSISLYTILYVIILGFFATPKEVGYYSAAEKIIRAICVLFYMPVSQVYFPKISYLVKNDAFQAKSILRKLIKFVGIITLCIGIVLFICSNWIVSLIGNGYDKAAELLIILCPLPLFISMGGIYGQLGLLTFGFKKLYRQAYFSSSILALVVGLGFTYFFKETGTSIALLITEVTVCYLMFKKVKLAGVL